MNSEGQSQNSDSTQEQPPNSDLMPGQPHNSDLMQGQPHNSGLTLKIVWLHIIGISTYNFQPFLVGGFVNEHGFSESAAGFVIAANMLGVCLALAAAIGSIHRIGLRNVIAAALILVVAGNLLSAFTDSQAALAFARFIAGFGEGLAMAGAITMVGMFIQPDRLFAFAMIGMSLYGVLGLYLLPRILESWKLSGVFLFLAAIAGASLVIFLLRPERSQLQAAPRRGGFLTAINIAALLVLACLMLIYTATNGVWAYYERIGNALGIGANSIGTALSAGLFASMVGAAMAATLGDKRGRRLPMTCGLLLCILAVSVLYIADAFPLYIVSVILLFAATGFCVPYFLGALAAVDHTGKLPVLGQLTIFIGNFAGPAFAAGLVTPNNYASVIITAGAMFIVALLLIRGMKG